MTIVNRYITECLAEDLNRFTNYSIFCCGKKIETTESVRIYYTDWLSSNIVYELVMSRQERAERKNIYFYLQDRKQWIAYENNEAKVIHQL
ncbi:hypothetical protein NRIC_28160 [Enterococcus florum]|uniref:Uncharacterized protein n=1 Tax=Enterococcus florum TaxID=2480627 RepID=A0A4P5P9Z2_9ENTE|nr:hypothetical protein [Enterococcus florum]GCF94925.1 hypothetical protein NRIC_28160 [Enterococcus florum]